MTTFDGSEKHCFLVTAFDLPGFGEVHDVYRSQGEASEAVKRYFDLRASRVTAYRCEMIPEMELHRPATAHKATVGISGKREWTPAEKARDGIDKRNGGKVTTGDYGLLVYGDIALTMFADANGRNNRILRRYAVSGPNLDVTFATIAAAQRAFDKAVKEAGNASS